MFSIFSVDYGRKTSYIQDLIWKMLMLELCPISFKQAVQKPILCCIAVSDHKVIFTFKLN